jgi:hypothetical protein
VLETLLPLAPQPASINSASTALPEPRRERAGNFKLARICATLSHWGYSLANPICLNAEYRIAEHP